MKKIISILIALFVLFNVNAQRKVPYHLKTDSTEFQIPILPVGTLVFDEQESKLYKLTATAYDSTTIATASKTLLNGGGETGLSSDYKIIAGVIRNSGEGWQLISTGGHFTLNIDSVTETAAQINIHYQSIGALEVVALQVTPDDDFAGNYEFGSTVGVGVAGIKITQPKIKQETHLITHLGNGVFSFPATLSPSCTYSTSLGRLRIYHNTPTDNNFPRCFDLAGTESEQTLYVPRGSSLAGNRTDFYFYNLDGTQKNKANPDVNRFYYTRSEMALDPNPLDPSTVISASGNVWIIGVMKVN